MVKIKLERPTQEEISVMKKRMDNFNEFLEMNNITPSQAVPMAMRFIPITCKGYVSKKELVSMFKFMVEGIYEGAE